MPRRLRERDRAVHQGRADDEGARVQRGAAGTRAGCACSRAASIARPCAICSATWRRRWRARAQPTARFAIPAPPGSASRPHATRRPSSTIRRAARSRASTSRATSTTGRRRSPAAASRSTYDAATQAVGRHVLDRRGPSPLQARARSAAVGRRSARAVDRVRRLRRPELGRRRRVRDRGLSGDPAASFPVESHKAGFPFDTDRRAALVTSSHVDAYLAAAEKLADFAAADPTPRRVRLDRRRATRARKTLVTDLGRRCSAGRSTTDEVERYAALVTTGTDAKDGVATALHAMLVSPASSIAPSSARPTADGRYRLTGYEVATALSYTFVGTTPRRDAARRGRTRRARDAQPASRAWARTLLADPRAREQVGEFALQWTGAQNVLAADKRADLFPDFGKRRAPHCATETRAFAAHVVFDGGGTFDELMTADYTVARRRRREVLRRVRHRARSAYTDGHARGPARPRVGARDHRALGSDLADPARPARAPQLPVSGAAAAAAVRRRLARRRSERDDARAIRDALGEPDLSRAVTSYIDSDRLRPRALRSGRPLARDRERPARSTPAGDMRRPRAASASAPTRRYSTLPELAHTIATQPCRASCFVRQYLRFSRGVRETLAERCARLRDRGRSSRQRAATSAS